MSEIAVGDTAQLAFAVTEGDTALAMGSGDVPVLATPRAIAWAEAATCAAVADRLDPGETTVGVAVSVRHLAATSVGKPVSVSATVGDVQGRKVVFDVEARCGHEAVLQGTVERIRVPRDRFLPHD